MNIAETVGWPLTSRTRNHADYSVASCAPSVQLSLLTECLMQSLATSSAVDSMLQERLSRRHDSITMPELFQPEIYDCGSPFLPTTPTCAGKHFCIACDISFTNSEALKKHQAEFCERKLDWICPTCPGQTFGLLDRLNRHHHKAHAGTCPHGCDKRKTYPSDHCKVALSQCYRTAPEKKAWGCPCCVNCFDTLEAWNQHKGIHGTQNEKVENWSFSTMVRSLLHQHALDLHFAKFPWWRCNWSELGKGDCLRLKLALERHVIPSVVSEHPDYSRLDHSEALALYTFRLGITGKACTQLISVSASEAAPQSCVPPSSNGSPEQIFPSCQPMNVTSQPQDWLDRGLASTSSEHAQSISTSPIPPDMDNDEMMTWDAFLSHYSPVHDPVNRASARSYETIPDNQQDLALTSAIMHGDSGSFLGHQQLRNQPPRSGFRHRVRRVLEEGLQVRHIH